MKPLIGACAVCPLGVLVSGPQSSENDDGRQTQLVVYSDDGHARPALTLTVRLQNLSQKIHTYRHTLSKIPPSTPNSTTQMQQLTSLTHRLPTVFSRCLRQEMGTDIRTERAVQHPCLRPRHRL